MKKLSQLVMMAAVVMSLSGVVGCNSGTKTDGASDVDSIAMVEKQKEEHIKNFSKQVEQINKELPMAMADGISLTKMEVKDGYLVLTCTYPEDAELKIEDTPETRKDILATVNKGALLRVKSLNFGVKYVYTQEGTDEETTITIPASEI